jgi:hypothetical protein
MDFNRRQLFGELLCRTVRRLPQTMRPTGHELLTRMGMSIASTPDEAARRLMANSRRNSLSQKPSQTLLTKGGSHETEST